MQAWWVDCLVWFGLVWFGLVWFGLSLLAVLIDEDNDSASPPYQATLALALLDGTNVMELSGFRESEVLWHATESGRKDHLL